MRDSRSIDEAKSAFSDLTLVTVRVRHGYLSVFLGQFDMTLTIESVTILGHIESSLVQGESIDTDPIMDGIAYRYFNAAFEVSSQKTGREGSGRLVRLP